MSFLRLLWCEDTRRRISGSAAGILTMIALVLSPGTLRASSNPDAEHFRFSEAPGPYAVGFKVVQQWDRSRAYGYDNDDLGHPLPNTPRPRPVQTLIWYPVNSSGESPMTVRDYVTLAVTDEGVNRHSLGATGAEWVAGLAPAMNDPLRAHQNAEALRGRFPLIIYSPSFSDIPMPWENADLCEYLASFGYVVMSAPNLGRSSRHISADVSSVNAQAADIRFLIDSADHLANVDRSSIAVVGFSWGGLAGLFAAARDPRITALVALDGSQRYYPQLVSEAKDVHPEAMTLPLLFFEQGNYSLETYEASRSAGSIPAPNVLNEWTKGDLTVVRMLGLVHFEFSSMYQRNEELWAAFASSDSAQPMHQIGDYGREEGGVGYALMARYTRAFLDATMKKSPQAAAFLRTPPSQNGAPKHFMSVDMRPKRDDEPSFDDFRSRIGAQGFGALMRVFMDMNSQHPTFLLHETELEDWGERLFDSKHPSEATDVLEFCYRLYPQSADAAFALARALNGNGQSSRANEMYQRAAALDPMNIDAWWRLRGMHAKGAGAETGSVK